SIETKNALTKKLIASGFEVSDKLQENSSLVVCIGGDGTFLEAIHKFNFPDTPFVGINTGHLGFYQELCPDQLSDFILNFQNNTYEILELSTVEALISKKNGDIQTINCLNEIVVRGELSNIIHLDISIGSSFIQKFSGDGILVATPSGSTAYNYSLGGSIVDPRIQLMQLTPIAPMNTTAYRSFTSSLMLPVSMSLEIVPKLNVNQPIRINTDHLALCFEDIEKIEIRFSEKVVKLLAMDEYDFWGRVKSKFL
ncbi:MAG: NAD(+)/NADH kinase, partial [Eubacteriales bacterium]